MVVCSYIFQSKGIQKYICAGDRLKYIAGGSELLSVISRPDEHDMVALVLGQCRWKPQFSRRAGGVFMLHFPDYEMGRFLQFEALWTVLFQQWVPGLEYTATLGKGESGEKALADAYKQAANGNIRGNPLAGLLPQAGPLAGTAPRTGLAAVDQFREDDERGDLPTTRKHAVAGERSYADQFFPAALNKGDYVWPVEMDVNDPKQRRKKKNHPEKFFPFEESNRIGLIHADISGLGALYKTFGDEVGDNFDKLRDLSDAIEKALRTAVQTATEQHLVPKAPEKNRKRVLPARPILLGGDDVTVLVRADLALDYAKTLLEAIEQETQKTLESFEEVKDTGVSVLTACAGVAFAGASMPFYLLSGLAESLCRYAKKIVKGYHGNDHTEPIPSAIAFHRVTTALIARRFDEILQHEETGSGGRLLTAQPYLVGDFAVGGLPRLDDLKALKGTLEGDEVGVGSLQEVRQLLFDQPQLAEEIYTRWRKTSERRARGAIEDYDRALKQMGNSKPMQIPFLNRHAPDHRVTSVTPLFDALEWKAVS
jgi:hypothetical protein